MASVENRIVSMQFDNANFERKLASTISGLDKLNASIANAGSRSGLEQIGRSADNVNFNQMGSAIDGISNKFLALSAVALTVLSNIVNRAVDAGINLGKSFGLDSISSGFKEYELQIGSIQTILANTSAEGTKLKDVTGALDELNEYADKTIYNFGQMTKNIGTFTAAGVGLDQSVQSIKGIANLAAISGSSSQQASSAMYQLSQAIATGSVKLIDWNSIVNAGMGGKVFQTALFETGKMMGTIADTPMDMSFKEWTEAGNTFRGSLEDGWLTAEVLTTTLSGFTGELTKSQILAMGYTKEQAKEIMRLGELGVESATKVRTLTQLMSTLREAMGSGWAQSFKIFIGDFEEATTLFTGLSDGIGEFLQENAKARNEMLKGFVELGGRSRVFSAIGEALKILRDIMTPIGEAFRKIFPATTSQSLYDFVDGIHIFLESLRPAESTIANIKRIFTGLFGALEIGWTILKEGAKFFIDLFKSLTGVGNGAILDFAGNIGDLFTILNALLVKGGGIKNFFNGLRESVIELLPYFNDLRDKITDFFRGLVEVAKDPGQFIDDLKDKFSDFFDGLKTFNIGSVSEIFDALMSRFEGLRGIVDKAKGIWEPFGTALGNVFDAIEGRIKGLGRVFDTLKDIWKPFGIVLSSVGDLLSDTWDVISEFFSELGTRLSKVMGPDDFDATLDVVNVGLLGGIALMIKKFIDNLNNSFGEGLFKGITKSLDQLTGILSAMQADIKAKALLKIAGAIAILTVSLILLSTIDSAALTKAVTAMGIGFGVLIAAFTSLNTLITGPGSAAKLAILASGLILLSGAMLILSVAVKILGDLSWNELIKGLTGVTVLLGVVTLLAGPLGKSSGGLIRAGIGMAAIGVGLAVLALAAKVFATMDWGELVKGLTGVGVGLALVAVGMQLMPVRMPAIGLGLLLVSSSLLILGQAMKQFADMNFRDMAFGLLGVGAGLTLIGLGLKTMPPSMPAIGLGLLLVSSSLLILGQAMKTFANMSFREIAFGLLGVGAGLTLIGLGLKLMPPSMPAIGLGLLLVSASLILIGQAMKTFAGFSWSEIGKGLATMAASLVILGFALKLMTGTIGGSIAVGIASAALLVLANVLKEFADLSIAELVMGLAGIAAVLALLGGAAFLLAPLIPVLLGLSVALLLIGAGFALFGLGAKLAAEAFEALAAAGKVGVESLILVLTELSEALPEIFVNLAKAVMEFITVILEALPGIMDAIVKVLGSLIVGIREIIPEVLETVGIFISGMLQLIVEKAPEFIEAGLTILTAFLTGIRDNIGEIVILVAEIITGFLDALAAKVPDVIISLVELFSSILTGVAFGLGLLAPTLLIGVGRAFLEGLWTGIKAEAQKLWEVITGIVEDIIGWIKRGLGINSPSTVMMSIGKDIVLGLINGIVEAAVGLARWFVALPGKILGWIGNIARKLWSKGVDLISGLLGGLGQKVVSVANWFKSLPGRILGWIGSVARKLWSKGVDFIAGLIGGIVQKAVSVSNWFKALPGRIFGWIGSVARKLWSKGVDLISGLIGGIVQKAVSVTNWFKALPGRIFGWVGSVARKLWSKGVDFIAGLIGGIVQKAVSVTNWFRGLREKIFNWVGSVARTLWTKGIDLIAGLLGGMGQKITTVINWFGALPGNIIRWLPGLGSLLWDAGVALIQGLWNGMDSIMDNLGGWLENKVSGLKSTVNWVLGVKSPSTWAHGVGVYVMQGLQNGLAKGAPSVFAEAENVTTKIKDTLGKLGDNVSDIRNINPTITPVLDLTQFSKQASTMQSLIDSQGLVDSNLSLNHARIISASTREQTEASTPDAIPTNSEVKFEQNIYAPKQLSASDIYKQTRNQITMAKEELSIP